MLVSGRRESRSLQEMLFCENSLFISLFLWVPYQAGNIYSTCSAFQAERVLVWDKIDMATPVLHTDVLLFFLTA